MCFFWQRKDSFDYDRIATVVILETTQWFTDRNRYGFSLGSEWDDGRIISMRETVPAGTEITFSVTYKDGTKEIIKEKSGTTKCDKLLQFAIDPFYDLPVAQTDADKKISFEKPKKKTLVSIGKNELPTGDYIIGEEIPEGTYDFTWVWGSGAMFVGDDLLTILVMKKLTKLFNY